MSRDQIVLFAILLVTVGLFLWGRWRHDMVALAALLACVALGIVPPGEAFLGFGHPAVITVACVLGLNQGLLSSGVVDAATQRFLPRSMGPTATIAALAGVAAFLSAFMNNIGRSHCCCRSPCRPQPDETFLPARCSCRSRSLPSSAA